MDIKARTTGSWSYQTRVLVWDSPQYDDRKTFVGSQGGQYVLSEGHPYRSLGKGDDVGGGFTSQKCEASTNYANPMWLRTPQTQWGRQYAYFTRVYPSNGARDAEQRLGGLKTSSSISSAVGALCPALVSDNNLDSRGTSAISRVKPTNPVVDGAATIAEAISERKIFAIPGRGGGISGEYLNYQLGVSPAIGAYQDFRKAAENSEKLLEQLHRDSGRSVRRRYEFPTDQPVETVETWNNIYPVADAAITTAVCDWGKLTRTTQQSTRYWFSGAFTYYVPKDVGLARSIAELEYLYGIKPGIDTAWELIPFSFVADYFANLGDVVQNLNSFAADGLVLNYGYIMAETVKTVHDVWKGPLQIDGSWRTVEVGSSRSFVNKQRKAATPYGFGLLDDDISLRQWSILAALGLNRR